MESTTRRNVTLILSLGLLLTLAAFSSAIEPARALGRLFQSTERTPGVGLKGEYFTNTTLDGSPVLTRIDPQVDFSWGEGSPASDIPTDPFSVRWTGQVEAPFSEDYTFHTLSDDGIRLSLNGQVIIENWSDHGPTWDDSSLIPLTVGQRYTLTLEYYENTRGADAHLEWSSPSTSRQVIPSDRLYPDVGIWTVRAAPETVMADGVATAAVTISLTDLADDPLPNLPAYLQVSGSHNWIDGQPAGEGEWVWIDSSDPNGIVTATLASTVAETKGVRARVQGVIVGGTATFIAAEPVGLQILLPGEAATPGDAPGKTGGPNNQTAGVPFEVTARAVDAHWNTATGVADTVILTGVIDRGILYQA
jgi:hypothetical protein